MTLLLVNKFSGDFFKLFFFPYIALIYVFASQMALSGFFLSPGTSYLMVED